MARTKAAPKEKTPKESKEPKLRRTAPLTNDEADFLYGLYLFLFNSSLLSLHGKYRAFETAAVDIFPWSITHISAKALEHLVTNGTAKGLRRGHRMQRKTRGEQLFDRLAPSNKAEMLEFFLENDKVTLVINKENGTHGIEDWSLQIEVPPHILVGGSYSVYATMIDKAWARDQWENLAK